MYVTRRLSHIIESPDSLFDKPEGPNLGYLVIDDDIYPTTRLVRRGEPDHFSCCFGLCKTPDRRLVDTPFPQNKNLTIRCKIDDHSEPIFRDVVFIPVLNHPLSSNLYYAIKQSCVHYGNAYTCSTREDKTTCCFFDCINDKNPKPFNPGDIYQQYRILPSTLGPIRGTFNAKSVAPDAYPPSLLRSKNWSIYSCKSRNFQLNEATGLNAALRAHLPDFHFPLSYNSSSPIVVGKWCCPFVFIKDGKLKLPYQMTKSMYYEMTLEQKWKKIFSQENDHGTKGNTVTVDVVIQMEVVRVNDREAVWDDKKVVNGVIWFKSYGKLGGEVASVGLCLEIVERMKWEEERGGWLGGKENKVKVKRIEEFGGKENKVKGKVKVERFVLKRMDGSIVLTYDFKHIHQIRCKWELMS